jgi:hypothetical protein
MLVRQVPNRLMHWRLLTACMLAVGIAVGVSAMMVRAVRQHLAADEARDQAYQARIAKDQAAMLRLEVANVKQAAAEVAHPTDQTAAERRGAEAMYRDRFIAE